MSIVSISYFLFLGIALLIYYLMPIKYRWAVILVANIYFLFKVNSIGLLCIWLLCAAVTYFSTLFIEKRREEKAFASKAVCVISVLFVLSFMLVLKDYSFFSRIINGILKLIRVLPIADPKFSAPLGISYYSLIWIGYILDVYWGTSRVEKNPLKFLAFCGYFPVYTSGPISRFQDVEENVVKGHAFDYKSFTFGLQRFLWGLLKKLVISERLAIVVNTIYQNTYSYPGIYVWIGMLCFVFQLYTDFSGCIDMAIGASEMFGISLPENFNHPFAATTLAEFWRRWHITLGGWLRDYILYPLLKSDLFQHIGASAKEKYGKKTGKKIPTWIGLTISWFLIGFWHGGQWNYIIGVGLFFGFVIIVSEMLTPAFDKLKILLKINTETFSYRLFQRIRTFFIFMIGLSFFRAESFTSGLTNWKNALTVYNPWILFDGSLMELGLDIHDVRILVFFGLAVAISGIVTFIKGESLRELIAKQNIVFRWLLYLILVYSVIIYGCYGIEFDSVSFIYQGF